MFVDIPNESALAVSGKKTWRKKMRVNAVHGYSHSPKASGNTEWAMVSRDQDYDGN